MIDVIEYQSRRTHSASSQPTNAASCLSQAHLQSNQRVHEARPVLDEQRPGRSDRSECQRHAVAIDPAFPHWRTCRGGRVPRRPAVTYRDLGLYCQQYENGKTYRHSNEGGYFHHEDNDSTGSVSSAAIAPSLNRYIYLSKARSAYPLVKLHLVNHLVCGAVASLTCSTRYTARCDRLHPPRLSLTRPPPEQFVADSPLEQRGFELSVPLRPKR
jgi:hypothetical protein